MLIWSRIYSRTLVLRIHFCSRSGSLDAPVTDNNTLLDTSSSNERIENSTMSNSEVSSLDDARRIVRDLRLKMKSQAQQLLAWRRAYKMQVRAHFLVFSLSPLINSLSMIT